MKEKFAELLDEITAIANKLMENKKLAADIVESHLESARDGLKEFSNDLDKFINVLKEKHSKKKTETEVKK